ncbi:MAG: DUF4282 domain-containing protein [Pseudomonadales bacterium]|nr:DUF4282 domain-containing protein [Pseudomonadales bacterium]
MKLSIDLRDEIKKIEKEKILAFFRMLFDFSFTEFLTVKMFPVLYFVILASTLFAILYLCFEAFLVSIPRGIFYLFVAAPVAFIAVATMIRGVMEFYIVVFRMAENVEEMRIVSNKFAGLTDTVEGVNRLTKRLPFWNIMSPRTPTKDTYSMADQDPAETPPKK